MALMFSPPGAQHFLNIYSANLVINTTSETVAIPFDTVAGDDALFYNTDWTPNSVFRTTLTGTLTTPLVGLGTLTFRSYMSNTLVSNTAGLSLTASLTNIPFFFQSDILLLPVGNNIQARSYTQFSSPAGSLMTVTTTDTVFSNTITVNNYSVTAQLSAGSGTQFLTINQGFVEWIYQ